MARLALSALAGTALVGLLWAAARPQPASAAVKAPALRASRGPFVPTGAFYGGATSGMSGDRSSRSGQELGCLSRRHYSFTITLRNRSKRVVTLTDVRGPNPLPRIVARVAVQFRPAPPPPTGDMVAVPVRHWSAAPARPLTVRPGKSALVQTNFLMRHCKALAHGRKVVIPGSFRIRFRQSGRAGRQHVVEQNAGFSVVAGPLIRDCARVPGSVSVTAANIGCAAARAAAPACHRMQHGTWGSCSAAGRRWDCDLHSSWVQQCFFPDRTSRWYRVRWIKRPG